MFIEPLSAHVTGDGLTIPCPTLMNLLRPRYGSLHIHEGCEAKQRAERRGWGRMSRVRVRNWGGGHKLACLVTCSYSGARRSSGTRTTSRRDGHGSFNQTERPDMARGPDGLGGSPTPLVDTCVKSTGRLILTVLPKNIFVPDHHHDLGFEAIW